MTKTSLHFAFNVLTVPTFILIWEIISRSGVYSINLFPPPSEVFRELIAMLFSGELISDSLLSLQRVIVGFAVGSGLGILFGILTGRIKMLDRTLGQLIQIFRPIPAIAFVPFAIIWFGLGESSKYFLIAWAVFFVIWLNSYLGVSNVNISLIWAAKSLGATNKQILYEVVLPHAVPFIIAGARAGIAIAFVALVAAEMAGAYGGIGYRISASYLVFRIDKMIVGLIMLGILGAGVDALFSKIIKKIIPWYGNIY